MIGALASAVWKIADDMVFGLWFGMKFKSKEYENQWRKRLNRTAGVLMMGLFFWLTSFHANVFTSFFFRLAGMTFYMEICKDGVRSRKFYASVIFTLAYYAHTIVFVTPVLAGVRRGEIPLIAGSLYLNKICVQLLICLAAFILIWIVRNGIDYTKIKNRWEFRYGMCAGLAILEIYMKYTLNEFGKKKDQIVELTIFAMIILMLIMIMLVFVEQYFANEDREEERHRMELLQSYQYESMKERVAAAQDVRCMYHDLKNHLLSISSMAGNGHWVQEYLTDMKRQLEGYETTVDTGNSMLDGIMSIKMKAARLNQIKMSVYLDFSRITFLRDIDICTIFGNAIDNAIEASMKVQDEEKRYIQIKNGVFANNLVIKIANYSEEEVEMDDGLPMTTKEDSRLHGLGLLSVKKTAAEYKGMMTVEQEKDQFVLKILIPMPAGDALKFH
ncbi:GHKL domain-containing protein [Clostridium sp. MCC353]|uniref:sensor histidine kinase n=1 Tax=Clostridium sp. MCC353 TaxID=2592646 RepID=UPI001C00C02D|nr:GHKL domain-containing protein [Clostridium sp. MCC353]MBT9777585.1 GHKL domain-containing protein [Clostridium sp. MCC353]